jgi:1-acyl-sn-glycerol-3-phosphate acyltransferase
VKLRRLQRAVALALALAVCIVRYWWLRFCGAETLEQSVLWLQESARRVLKRLHAEIEAEGQPPACGLVVANHLSYLDILIFSAAMPCFFVAKMEVDRWPIFGRAARAGGTIFLDRSSGASTASVAGQIAERLNLPLPVLLFPEGTSTDGTQVLRFHSRLIEPAIAVGAPITAAAIGYEVDGGAKERELCWYGDDEFMTHLWRVLGIEGFSARLRFGEPRIYANRRVAAARTHAEVTAMREAHVSRSLTV